MKEQGTAHDILKFLKYRGFPKPFPSNHRTEGSRFALTEFWERIYRQNFLAASWRRYFLVISLLMGALPFFLSASEYTDGRIRLVLHEGTGRFSLYYMTSPSRYEAFFVDQDPRTSFLSVIVNDRSYKLGETSAFRTRIGGTGQNPAVIFESSFLSVTQEFAFIKTPGSQASNGIRMTLRLENRASQQASVGIRMLLDTNLGEGGSQPHFIIDSRSINLETLIESGGAEQRWVSRNNHLSLMGSIAPAGERGKPDAVHFANWKRLSDVSWKLSYSAGRNFNYPPYSVGDSAVCYYFNPIPLARGETQEFSLYLSAEDELGFESQNTALGENISRFLAESIPLPDASSSVNAPVDDAVRQSDINLLRELIARIDEYIASESITDEELAAIETVINRLKTRYNVK
ncbi:MAG: hypothetical protein LBQ88_16560 [Treponema sp.]|jgi:hypothetical protein|nr:hypothetical protein [Treponema sp.]